MSIVTERTETKAPTTYQEWLDCFETMKHNPVSGNGVFDAVASGSFTGTEITIGAMQNQVVETVNAILDKSVKRFIKELNESISFNDLSQIDVLFRHLKRDIEKSLFFENLFFLPKTFRTELSQSVKTQMQKFWNDTVKFLYEQSLEFSNSELEDVLFLINRIHLFKS
ncbi:MAG: hypothetical protein J1F23_06040 [Oscillospiraceae bacterium]|nr:hypothetical protein [Oscillospiraceae bacterium]